MRTVILPLISIFMLFMPMTASAAPLAVGDDIPESFTALDSLGRQVNFQQIKGNYGLILLFTRSADWCQYCKTQLRDWNTKVEAAKELGYSIAAISYDSPSQLEDFAEKNKLRYTLLSDTNSKMIEAFGIRNTKFDEGSRFYGIPNPAIYVIDETGTISHVFREEDYQNRPEIQEIMAVINVPRAPVEAEPIVEE